MATFSPATVSELIEAIETANSNGEADVIELAANTTFTLTEVDNDTDGPNGLPNITGEITINGNGAIIERDNTNDDTENEVLFRIFHIASTGKVTLNDVTIRKGKAPISDYAYDGGGIYSASGSVLTIINSIISNNIADFDGGGIYSRAEELTITNCTLSNNTASRGGGGGVYQEGGALSIADSEISENQCNQSGGGIYSYGCLLNINGSVVRQNTSSGDGGGIGLLNSSAMIVNTEISNNEIIGSVFEGGGVSSFFGPLIIEGCTISGNTAQSEGGGICCFHGALTVNSSNISSNSCEGEGGGISHYDGDLRIVDSTISGNQAGDGSHSSSCGGICHDTGSVSIERCTISQNKSYSTGGGISTYGGSEQDDTVAIIDSVISDNHALAGEGGGIESVDAHLQVKNTTLSLNTASGDGGGIWHSEKTLTITDCTFTDNDAEGKGGAIFGEDCTEVNVSGCAIALNRSSDSGGQAGGGIYIDDNDSVRITNCEIVGNQSSTGSGGIWVTSQQGDVVQINNCFIANNQFNAPSYAITNNTPSVIVDAKHNWWGAEDGPSGPGADPEGSGDSISTGIDYGPFFESADDLPDGVGECPWCFIGGDQWASNNPISLRKGEKRLEVTDLSLTTPAGPLTFTRYYRQSKQTDDDFPFTFMGLGWTHNHRSQLQVTGTSPNREAKVLLSNGSILTMKEDSGDVGHFEALVGSNAALDESGSVYTLTAPDGSTCVFEIPPGGSSGLYVITSRTWPNGERWTYRYYDDDQYFAYGKLKAVDDGYGRKLQFTYIDHSNEFDDLQLYRVGDQEAAGLAYGDIPSGRFVEFTYIEEYEGGAPKSPYPKAMLSQVRDLRGEKWTYVYYGQASGETDADQLNLLVERKSPAVDGPGSEITLEQLTYTFDNGEITAITQERGDGLMANDYAFNVQAANRKQATTETVKDTSLVTTHRFMAGAHVDTEDPLGHATHRVVNALYRPDSQVDANGNETRLAWDAEGKQLESVTDALGHETAFNYDGNDRLSSSVDVAERKTTYVYDSDSRQPTMVMIAEDTAPVDPDDPQIDQIDIETADNWTATGSAAKSWLTPQVDAGGHARYVDAPQNAGIESENLSLVQDQLYTIVARVYPIDGTVKMQLSNTTAVSEATVGSDAWETLEATYTPTQNETRKLQFIADGGAAEFYVDSVVVTEEQDLAINGDMESNDHWSAVESPTTCQQDGTQKHGGSYAWHVVGDEGEGVEGEAWNLVANRQYAITAYVYRESGAVKMQVSGTPAFDVIVNTGSGWQKLEALHTPAFDLDSVTLQFVAEGGSANFYVDDVVIEEVQALDLDGDMDSVSGHWTDVGSPDANERRPHADTGSYVYRIDADAGEGIQSDTWDMVAGQDYAIMARVHPEPNTTAKLRLLDASNTVLAEASSEGENDWETLRLVYRPDSAKNDVKLRLVADANNALFYADTAHVYEVTSLQRWQDFCYDGRGRTLEEASVNVETAAFIQKTTRAYHTAGNSQGLLKRVDQHDTQQPNNTVYSEYTYDSAGRVVKTKRSSTLGDCCATLTEYDAAGNVVSTVNVRDTSQPDDPVLNPVTTYGYDALGRRNEVTVQVGTDFKRTTITVYDALGRVLRTVDNYVAQGDPATDPADWVWNANATPPRWERSESDTTAIEHGDDDTQNIIADTAYNKLGLVKFRRDVLGHVTLYGYDDAGRLVKTVQNAATPDHNNDFTGNSPNEADPSLSAYPYAPNILSAAPDQDIITEQVYDAAGNLVKTIDSLGNLTVTIYDALNRAVATIRNPSNPYYYFAGDPELDEYTLSADPATDLVEKTVYDNLGRVQETQHLVSVVDSQEQWATTRYVYDDLDRPVRTIVNYVEQGDPVVDPAEWLWNEDHWEYSAGNDVDHGENDLNLITHTEYGDDGRVLWTRDPAGQQTWHVYDGFGRQVLSVANYTDNNYEPPDQWVWEDGVWKDSEDGTTIQHGDNSDLNVVTQTFYDAEGRVLRTRDTRGSETHYAYDTLGRQILIGRNFYDDGYIDTDIGQWTWDSNDGRWEDKDGLEIPRGDGNDRNVIAATSYDQAGRVDATRDAAGAETRYAYDILGRQTLVVRNFYDDGYIDTDVSQWLWSDSALRWEDGSQVAIPHGTAFDRNLISATTYDLAGRAADTRDARGTQTAFVYDAVGRQQQVRQAASSPLETVSYTCYNKAGQVLRTIANWTGEGSLDEQDTDGWTFAPGYNDGGYNDRNRIVEYTYDAVGRRVKVIDPVGYETVTVYGKDGQVDTVTDPEGVVSLYRYDGLRRRRLVVQNYAAQGSSQPENWVWLNGQWEDGSSQAIDHKTDESSDNEDQNVIVQVDYDLAGRKTSQREPNGNQTVYRYDQLGRRITQVSNYQPQGSPETNPADWVWDTDHWEDGNDNNIEHGTQGDENAFITQTTYQDVQDENGFTGETCVTVTKPDGTQTTRDADRLGRPKSIGYGDAANTYDVTFTYDVAGNREKMIEDNGTSNQRITGYAYDEARRLTQVAFDTDGDESADEVVAYAYDLGGQRTGLTLPGDLSITYTYDRKGRLVSLTDWDGHQTRFVHDNANRLVAAERANGLTSRYRYDAAGRLRLLRHTHGAHTLAHFAYDLDKRGNRIRVLEMLAHPATTNDVTYAYDDTSIAYQGTWTPDAATYMKSEGFSASLRLAFFGPSFELTVGTGPNHSIFDVYVNGSLWRSFDGYAASSGELAVGADLASEGPHILELRNRAEHSPAALADANYDPDQFIVRFKQLVAPDVEYDLRTIAYTYDKLSRVTYARYYPGINTMLVDDDLPDRYQFIYDRVGNRELQERKKYGTVDSTVSLSFNEVNQIKNENFTYDANGNLTSDGVNAYTWDRANRLTGMGGLTYAYDGAGNRISQSDGVDVTKYLLDLQPGLPLVVAQTKNGNTDHFVHLPGRGIFAQEDNVGAWEDLLLDGLGSTRMVVDDASNVDSYESYAPYGEPLETGSFGSPFTFTGEPMDANDLLYLRARYYSPALGMFTALDPMEIGNRYQYVGANPTNDAVGEPMSLNRYSYVAGNPINDAVGEPMSLNRYSYVAGNPTNFVDPSGMIMESPGTGCPPNRQNQDCEFTECHARYLAHAALSEAKWISRCAMVALVLSQLNYYERSKQVVGGDYPGSFVTLEAIASGAFTPRVPQAESYTAFMAACQQDTSFDLPTFQGTKAGAAERDALAIARAIVWGKCNHNKPLAAFEEYATQYRQTVDPAFSAVNFDLDLSKLHNVIEKNLWDEQSVRTTAYQAFLATWKRDESLWYLWPGQGQTGVEYEFFEGAVGGSTLLLANIANPTHVNWQCEQNPSGIPIVWALITDGVSILGGKTCSECPKGVELWDNPPRFPKVCKE